MPRRSRASTSRASTRIGCVRLSVDTDATPVGSVLAELGDYPWSGDVAGGHSPAVPVSVEEVLAVDPVWSTLGAVADGRVSEVDATLWGPAGAPAR